MYPYYGLATLMPPELLLSHLEKIHNKMSTKLHFISVRVNGAKVTKTSVLPASGNSAPHCVPLEPAATVTPDHKIT